jgi:hypothetical protein
MTAGSSVVVPFFIFHTTGGLMSEVKEPEGTPTDGSQDDQQPDGKVENPEHFEKLKRERDAAKQKARTYEQQLAEAQQKLGEYEQAKMSEQERLQAQLEEAKKQADSYKQMADVYLEYESKRKKDIRERLGNDYAEEFDSLPLQTLEAIADKLTATKRGHTPPPGGKGNIKLEGLKYEDILHAGTEYMEELQKNPQLLHRLKEDWKRRGSPQ